MIVLALLPFGMLRAQGIEEGPDARPRGTGAYAMVDRFGYPWFRDSAIVGRLTDADSDPAVVDCSGFTLYFEDVALASGGGFDDPALGVARRETACAVFAYLASIIDLNGARPDIIVQASEGDGAGPLGVGSPFYAAVTSPGFIGGMLRDHIVLRGDPTPAPGDFDGRIRIDFGARQGGAIPIHSDYRTPAGGEIDLYSVILHEMMHALGFNTLIGPNGGSLLGGAYSIFDRSLERNGTPLINPATFRFQETPGALTSSQLRYSHPANSRSQSAYSPLVFSPGSSIAHFDPQRDADDYLMRPSTAGGEDRTLGGAELDVLCNLGYTLRGALCSDRYPVGLDDAGSADPGATICIDVLANDRDPDGDPVTIDPASIEIVNGGGTVTITGGRLCYTPAPAFRGTAYLRYAPTDGRRRGSPARVLVRVIGTGGCPDDPCNYLCNGSFEGGTSNTADLEFDSMIGCPSKVDNWCGAEGSPDLYVRGAININFGIPTNVMTRNAPSGQVNTWDFPNPGNNRYLGILWDGPNDYNEGLYARLVRPLQPGRSYTFRMHAITVSNCGRCRGIDDELELVLDTARPAWTAPRGVGQQVVAAITSPNVTERGGGWELVERTFTATRADEYLILRAKRGQAADSRVYTYIDDLSLTETDAVPLKLVMTVDNPGPARRGTVSYTIELCNPGGTAATGVVIEDILPRGLTYAGGFSAYPRHDVGDLAPGECRRVILTATVDPDAPVITALTNCAGFARGGSSCATLAGNCVDVAIPATDLAVTKTVDDPSPQPGGTVLYTVTVRNLGPADAHHVVVRDLLPSGLTYLSHVISTGAYDNTSGLCVIPLLPAGGVVTMTVTAAAAGIAENCAALVSLDEVDLNGENDAACAPLLPARTTNIAMTKTVDVAAPAAGDRIVYTVTVENNGGSDAHNVAVRDLLPAGVSYLSHTASIGSYVPGTGMLAIPLLPRGRTATLTITATALESCANCAELVGLDEDDVDARDDLSCAAIVVGSGGGLALRWRDASAAIGAEARLPLAIERDGDTTEGLHLRADVRFDASILHPIDLRSLRPGLTGRIVDERIDGGERVVTIDLLGPLPLSGDIAELRCTSLLGDRESAVVSFAGVVLESVVTGMPLPVDEALAGTFHLLGVCPSGGARLLGTGGVLKLALRPNPFSALATAEIETVEDGMVRLSVVDPLGRRVAVPLDASLPAGSHRAVIDGATLPSGIYWLVLDTPSRVVRERFVVAR